MVSGIAEDSHEDRNAWGIVSDLDLLRHEVTHLVVLDPQTGHAVGVLSTHDLAGVIGSGKP